MSIDKFRQVATVRELMRSRQWDDQKAISLAQAWGLAPGEIGRIANEAHRALLTELPDDAYADMMSDRIRTIGEEAREAGNHGAALRAADLEMKVNGYWARMAIREKAAERKRLRDEERTIDAPEDPVEVIRMLFSDHRLRHIARKELDAYNAETNDQATEHALGAAHEDDPPDSAD